MTYAGCRDSEHWSQQGHKDAVSHNQVHHVETWWWSLATCPTLLVQLCVPVLCIEHCNSKCKGKRERTTVNYPWTDTQSTAEHNVCAKCNHALYVRTDKTVLPVTSYEIPNSISEGMYLLVLLNNAKNGKQWQLHMAHWILWDMALKQGKTVKGSREARSRQRRFSNWCHVRLASQLLGTVLSATLPQFLNMFCILYPF